MPVEHRCTVCCLRCPARTSTSLDVGQAELLITLSSCWMKMSLEQVWNQGLIVIQDADQNMTSVPGINISLNFTKSRTLF